MMIRVFLAACVLISAATAQAQSYTWRDVTPPNTVISTSRADRIAVHPHDAGRLAATGNFAYLDPQGALVSYSIALSTDAGATWRPSPAPPSTYPPYQRLYAHIGTPGLLFLARDVFSGPSGEISYYRSNDFGVTWERGHNAALTFGVSPYASDPLDPTHLFGTLRSLYYCVHYFGCLSPTDASVVESHDGGVTWSPPLPGLPQPPTFGNVPQMYENVDGPTPAAPWRMFFARHDAVFMSTDGGASWRAIDTSAGPLRWVRQDPRRANVLYALRREPEPTKSGRTTLVRSDDSGATWHTIFNVENKSLPSDRGPMVTIDPVRTREIWLTGLEAGVYRSGDAGESWQYMGFPAGLIWIGDPVNERIDTRTIVKDLTISASDPRVVYLIHQDRLYRGEPSARHELVIAEFVYEGDRYWMASRDGEALSQDYRMEPGHVRRTGAKIGAWRADNAPAGAVGSCRFWPRPQTGLRTRVLVLQGFECDALKRSPDWILEAENEFFAVPPVAGGGCSAGLVPVRRFNNLQPDANHRWVADEATAAEMRGPRAWYDEGVRFCARSLGPDE